mmetsp:Transcript_37978/g.96045  ORF Transcript_37978/g.96045 Transcript_37978/m.96045 type:complete len:317 (-) Transcript_37978:356-1306(-)
MDSGWLCPVPVVPVPGLSSEWSNDLPSAHASRLVGASPVEAVEWRAEDSRSVSAGFMAEADCPLRCRPTSWLVGRLPLREPDRPSTAAVATAASATAALLGRCTCRRPSAVWPGAAGGTAVTAAAAAASAAAAPARVNEAWGLRMTMAACDASPGATPRLLMPDRGRLSGLLGPPASCVGVVDAPEPVTEDALAPKCGELDVPDASSSSASSLSMVSGSNSGRQVSSTMVASSMTSGCTCSSCSALTKWEHTLSKCVRLRPFSRTRDACDAASEVPGYSGAPPNANAMNTACFMASRSMSASAKKWATLGSARILA